MILSKIKRSFFVIMFIFTAIFNVNLFAKTTAELQEEIIELYVATFNRPPDKAGLDYWLGEMQNNSWAMEKVATSFFDQTETKEQYSDTLSTNEFIDKIYQNILNRSSDSAGKDYWKAELDSGKISKQKFIIAILNGAKANNDALDDQAILNNKKEVAKYYTLILKNNDSELGKATMGYVLVDVSSVEDAKNYLYDSLPRKRVNGKILISPNLSTVIEIVDMDGNVLKKSTSTTEAATFYTYVPDNGADFIIKAYNPNEDIGTFLNYYSNGDEVINLTPLSTLSLVVSDSFSDDKLKDKISKAKELISQTYGVNQDEFENSDSFVNFNITKFKELVKSNGFDPLINKLAIDTIDGYADKDESIALFATAKQRILEVADSKFEIVDSDLDSDNISKLTIRGVSEQKDGTTGTMDMLTDVIATKTDTFTDSDGQEITEENIVFRSFNVGKWKGQLNEETTLLSRIFIDFRLMNLTQSVQEEIATELLTNRAEAFQNTIKYQNMATDIPFVYPYYIELMEGLRVFALSYIPNNSIEQSDKVENTLAVLSRSMRRQNREYSSDKDNFIQMGLLQVRATNKKLEFANYAKVNYGFRAYEVTKIGETEGTKISYDYKMSDFQANIIKSTVQGGAVGGLYDFMRNKFVFKSDGNTIDYNKTVTGDIVFDKVTKLKLEMYKWQFGYPTLLNVADGLELAIKVGNSSGKSLSEKIKEKFDLYEKIKKASSILDTSITITNTFIDGWQGMLSLIDNDTLNEYKFSSEFIKAKEEMNEVYDDTKFLAEKVNKILSTKGYETNNIKDWNTIASSASLDSLGIPQDTGNGFKKKMDEELLKNDSQKNNIKIFAGLMNKLLKTSNIDPTKVKDFNDKHKDSFTFDEMLYIMSYKIFSKDKDTYKNIYNTFKSSKISSEKIIKKIMKDYTFILVDKFGKGLSKISISDIVKAGIINIKRIKENIKIVTNIVTGVTNLVSLDRKKVFTAVSSFLINFVDSNLKNIMGDVAKSAAKALLGGGVTAAFAANDISSYVAGNFLTPNKQYLELNKDGDKISIKRPPLTLVGIDSNRIYRLSGKGWDNIFNEQGINSSYLMAVDDETKVAYTPEFNVYLSQVRKSNFKDMLKSADFALNHFMIFDYNIEKSNNNKIDGDFIGNNISNPIIFTVDDILNTGIRKGENDLYSFNLISTWFYKMGQDHDKVSVSSNTRGLYRDYVRTKFIQPTTTEKEFILPEDLSLNITGKKNYMYKASTGKAIGKNIIVEKVNIEDTQWLKIKNNNSFGIYMYISYVDKVSLITDNIAINGDFYIAPNSEENFPYTNQYLDDKGNHNDVTCNFYDEIAQDFFANNGFTEPRLKNYLGVHYKYNINGSKESQNILIHSVKIDNADNNNDYLIITSYGNGTQTESTLSDKGEVKVEFNMPLSSESIKQIQVYDNGEKRYLESSEYTVVHTSGNEYLITINNYRNHHEYKLVFPNTLVSETGAKFLEDREIPNFIYYNQKPIANAGEDKTITLDEQKDYLLDGSASFDTDGTIVKVEWFYENKLVWTGETFPLKNLNVSASKYVFTLIVFDDEKDSSKDEVTITITSNPQPPTSTTKNLPFIKKTGQNITYSAFDDGDLEIGIALNYTLENKDILDRVTGLKWQDEEENNVAKYSWEEAKDYCNNRGSRLPLREELSSLIHYDNYNPAIDKIFEYTANDNYWTLSSSKTSPTNAWIINFAYGTESTSTKTTQNYVRCVNTATLSTANAGEDQFIEMGNAITLSATHSILKELIYSYSWEENGELLGSGELLELNNIRDGEHYITLTIKDKQNNILSTDHTTVTIISKNKVVKQTGQNISYSVFDDGDLELGSPLNYTTSDNDILDRATGLLWKDTTTTNTNTYTWEEARTYCNGLSGDWRVPMREELSGLIHYGNYNPAIDASFSYTANENYWTLSTSQLTNKSAWVVNFAYGTESTSTKTTQNYLRCVDANSPARANAGADLFVEKGDPFKLIGSYSPHKELISSYSWIEYGTELGYTEILTISDMLDGEHKIFLMIEDDEGNTDIDETLITIVTKHDKLKVTGQSETYGDYDDGYYHKGYSLNYSDNGSTVSDGVLNIVWQDDGDTDNNSQTWQKAKEYCATLNLSGSWRLPTRQELSSLIHYGNYNPAIDSSFDDTANDNYWSISTSDNTNKSAWVVNFAYGTESTSTKTSSHFIRCVKTTN